MPILSALDLNQPRLETNARAPLSAQHLLELDGVRGIAILLVFTAHYFCFTTVPRSPLAYMSVLVGLGSSGVDLFFVLSGFLIGGILIDNRKSPSLLKTFYIRRACRILPLYYLLLTSLLIVTLLGIDRNARLSTLSHGMAPPWTYFLFFQNLWYAINGGTGPFWLNTTWSLAIEEQSYLFLSVIARFFSRRVLLKTCVVGILICPLLRWLSFTFLNPAYNACLEFDGIFWGVVLALSYRSDAVLKWSRNHSAFFLRGLALLSCGMIGLTIKNANRILPSTAGGSSLGVSLVTLFYVCFVWVVLTTDGKMTRLLRAPLLRFFGKLCYGIYLLHILIPSIVSPLVLGTGPRLTDRAGILVVAISGALTIAIAKLSWDFFEKRILAVGKAYTYG